MTLVADDKHEPPDLQLIFINFVVGVGTYIFLLVLLIALIARCSSL